MPGNTSARAASEAVPNYRVTVCFVRRYPFSLSGGIAVAGPAIHTTEIASAADNA